MEEYQSVGIAAGSLMIRYEHLSRVLKQASLKLEEGDNLNIFINLEGVLRNLTLQKKLPSLINFHKQEIVIELEAAILNLMAHYKRFFILNKYNVTMYFYFSSLSDNKQEMEVYNKYYRSYYKNKYMKNPQFRQMGELMNEVIIPEVKLILLYVPGCYFIEANTFDSSIIPYAISSLNENKNVIITSDIFDTLYFFNPNFITVYIKRKFQYFNVMTEIGETIQSIIKNESPFDLNLFTSEMYYRLLLSIKGSKIRNIKSAKGFGYGKFLNLLKKGLDNNIVLKDFSSLDSIIELFPVDYREDIKNAFQCTSIETQYELLNDIDIAYIKSQIIDKVDNASLDSLNNRRFLDHPINLAELMA